VNHTRLPKDDHLPDWARRDSKVIQGDHVDPFYLRHDWSGQVPQSDFKTKDLHTEAS